MSEVVPTRDQIAGVLADLDIDNMLLSPEAKVLISTATIDTAFLRGALRLALSALDAQEAAGEGVTEDCWYPVVSALGAAGETDPYTLGKAAVDAVHPVIFAAGERAGLEKAAVWLERESFTNGPATDAAAAIIDRFRTDAPENDAAPTIDVAEFALFDAAKHIATAIRSLKGGTP